MHKLRLPHPVIYDTDSYKLSHYRQYPPGTTYTYSYIEARKNNQSLVETDGVLWFGLNAIIRDLLSAPITQRDIDEMEAMSMLHGMPFNRDGWQHILDFYNGYLPLYIRALPEGTFAPFGVPLMTIESTDPDCYWLPSYLETALLRVWYPTTVATISHATRRDLKHFLEISSDNVESALPFMLHDFGSRGVSSSESAGLGGLGHLLSFKGTDNLAAVHAGKKYYDEPCAGYSIPAAEHSTMTSWGKEGEVQAYSNMLDQFPDTPVAIVCDAYNFKYAVDEIFGKELKEKIQARSAPVVIRPDSGDPVEQVMYALVSLAKSFGTQENSKGYDVLNHVRIVQGDGLTPDKINEICARVTEANFSVENLVFGMGGALLQKVNRDTFSFAMKCSAARINDKIVDVYKDPVDQPEKQSKRGVLDTVLTDTGLRLRDWNQDNDLISMLRNVYVGGIGEKASVRLETFDEIRKRALTNQ